jgi:hypothetical protein
LPFCAGETHEADFGAHTNNIVEWWPCDACQLLARQVASGLSDVNVQRRGLASSDHASGFWNHSGVVHGWSITILGKCDSHRRSRRL